MAHNKLYRFPILCVEGIGLKWSFFFVFCYFFPYCTRKHWHINFPMHEISRWRGVPRMCFVSTVSNLPSIEPYLFCNYQHRPDRHEAAAHYQRTSKAQCWEAIMASSAAPGFFEEVKHNQFLLLVRFFFVFFSKGNQHTVEKKRKKKRAHQ